MGEILLKTIEREPRHENTLREYSKEIQQERFHYVTKMISENIPLGKSCFVFGMGKHPKSTYTTLKKVSGVEVVWYGSLLPGYLAPFRILVASYEGIIKIVDTVQVSYVFDILSRMSMVGLYVFDKKLESEFVDEVKEKRYSNYADEIVKRDSSYLIYKIDADSVESSTGIYEIVSYGKNCPRHIVVHL